MKAAKITREEIEQYYGSVEAYNEEQRRCGMCGLETASKEGEFVTIAAGQTSANMLAQDGGKLTFSQRLGHTFDRLKKQTA